MKFLLFLGCVAGAAAQSWIPQQSGTTASLRGVSVVNSKVVWASGTKGTFLRTMDGGETWTASTVAGAADLDFRDVQAVDEKTAYLLSSGEGPLSRIYKTTDGGKSWSALLVNPDSKGFWDAFAFWDETHGIAIGDPVDGRFAVLTTSDGVSWQRQKGPSAMAGEGAFAASGSCVFTLGAHEAWFGTGGPSAARVFHTTDGGKTWTVATTPVRHDSASSGIFSLGFSGALRGIAMGGDYSKASEAASNMAVTMDGGKTWAAAAGPSGYRSAVAYLAGAKLWIATGTSGSDVSRDGGVTWTAFDQASYNAIGVGPGGVWAVGPNGAIAKLRQ